jgi:hypothetical protein
MIERGPKRNYAHAYPEGRPPEEWQPPKEHLRNVAEIVRKFAEPFGGTWFIWRCCGMIWGR